MLGWNLNRRFLRLIGCARYAQRLPGATAEKIWFGPACVSARAVAGACWLVRDTEGAVDMAKNAGLSPAAVSMRITNPMERWRRERIRLLADNSVALF